MSITTMVQFVTVKDDSDKAKTRCTVSTLRQNLYCNILQCKMHILVVVNVTQ